jgi:PmbA protein
MDLLDPARARRLTDAALARARGVPIEVSVQAQEQALNRFTADHPIQNLVRRTAQVSVRVLADGGRQGRACTGTLTEEGVARTVDRALALAALAPAAATDAPVLALPAPQAVALRGRGPLAPDPVGTARAVAAMSAACRAQGCRAAGIHATESTLRVVRNSAGLDVADHDTQACVSLSAFRDDGAGWGQQIAETREGLDADAVAARAVGKALASRNPAPLPPGRYTVVLEPAAVGSLLLFAASAGFGAQQVQDGSSFLAGKVGSQVFGSNVDLADDCRHPLTIGPVFDGEGLPRQRVHLVERGVARGLVHDRVTARRDGCASTGHSRPQPNADGPLPENLVLAAGRESQQALIVGVERGLLVTQFHYSNVVEPTQLTLTGMTRNGTFLIERGEILGPVRNFRYTQSLVQALQRVTGLGSDATLASALFGGHVVVPSLRIEEFGFSSGTEF